MTSKRKAVIIITSLSVLLAICLVSTILVIVASLQTASSRVYVKYKAEDVAVRISANVYANNEVVPFTRDATITGNKFVDLSTNTSNVSLYQPNNSTSIEINRTSPKAVFEYIFLNLDDKVDVLVELSKIPTNINGEVNSNLTFSYVASYEPMNNEIYDLQGETGTPSKLLPAYIGDTESRLYLYIIVEVDDLMDPADLRGSFEWSLTRPKSNAVATYTLNMNNVQMVERTTTGYSLTSNIPSTMQYKTLTSSTETNIDVIPARANATFLGWSTSSSATTPEIISAPNGNVSNNQTSIQAVSSKTLYPVFATGTVPSTSYSYVNDSYTIKNTKVTSTITSFVVPDVYNNGTNGIAKVTKITDGSSTTGVMNGNTSVTKITLGRNLETIGKYSFYNCTEVKEINYYATNASAFTSNNNIFTNVGSGTNGVTLNIGSNVQNIPAYFVRSSSTSSSNPKIVTITFLQGGNTPLEIGDSAFALNTNYNQITFPERLVSIGNYSFERADGLVSVSIPANVKSIGASPFSGSYRIETIQVDGNNKYYDSRDNCNALIETSTNKLISASKNTHIPSTVRELGILSFYNLRPIVLNHMVIPRNVEIIGKNAFKYSYIASLIVQNPNVTIEEGAFSYCSYLTSIDIKADLPTQAFTNCTNLTNITVNSKEISQKAFYNCTKLESVTFGQNVETIGFSAFNGCTALTSVTIPGNIKTVEDGAFSYCSNLREFIIQDGVEYLGFLFISYTQVTSLYIPRSVTTLGIQDGDNITSLEFEEVGVTWEAENIDGHGNTTIIATDDPTINASYYNGVLKSEHCAFVKQS